MKSYNTQQKLNWGIIGAGQIANTMADALKNSPNNFLYAAASKTQEKAKAFAERHGVEHAFSYEEIVNCKEIDVIYVATTHNFHFENARLALEHGKHVLIEKPFTVNAKEASELATIAREKKLFLMEAIWTRFLPVVQEMKKKIENGEIGKVKQITVSFGGFVKPKYEKRLKDPALAGGVTLDMGIYPISFVCYLLGGLPSEIKSMAYFSGLGVDETANYVFRFPSGCLTTISTSYNLKMSNEAIIYGSKGYITFPDFPAGKQFTVSIHGGTNEIKETIDFKEDRPKPGFLFQVDEVFRRIQDGEFESKVIPLNETIEIMELMDTMRAEWGFKYPFE